jgi:hypothetical protein
VASTQQAQAITLIEAPDKAAPTATVKAVGRWFSWSNIAIYGAPVFLTFGLLVYRFTRPKSVEETRDTEAFTRALKSRSDDIFKRCGTPREVRRFLNYLRLIATESRKSKDGKSSLRERYGDAFERDLIDLASTGRMPDAGAEGADVEAYFKEQCSRFGLDPKTFLPDEIHLDDVGAAGTDKGSKAAG